MQEVIKIETINKKIDELKEYEKNPRRNDKAVKYVANSIEKFGFLVPIVIDKNNVIVCGHTRYKASKKLKLKEVPCVVADELTEDEIKAFRIADNKVAEKSEWNIKLLQEEIKPLVPAFNFENFGFEIAPPDKPNERVKTVEKYNLDFFIEDLADNKWGMPELLPEDHIPSDLIGFNYAKTSKDYEKGIHFYIDDYQFERIWSNPERYMEILINFDCSLTPDFSLYLDMPLAMQMWNVYRSRMIGQIMQQRGIITIPTVSWSTEESFDFCFEGLPANATLSVSTIGVKNSQEAFNIWKAGMDEMIKRLRPKRLLVYGGKVDYNYENIDVIYFKNNVTEKMKKGGGKNES